MRCIFCKCDSSESRSVEHIVPESLGNTRHVLPRGVVCDSCNNYFARKIEAPFLESPAVRNLRFHQEVQNKRGRIPPIEGVISSRIPALVTRHPNANSTSVQIPERFIPDLLRRKTGTLILPLSGRMPDDVVTSRFMAKVALEAMAMKVVDHPEGLAYLVDEIQLDALRVHARQGHSERWPIHIRTLYAPDARIPNIPGEAQQVLHEWDFLATPWGEWFFALAIFGCEFVINLGGAEIGGYERWLEANEQASPLYQAKHGGLAAMPR